MSASIPPKMSLAAQADFIATLADRCRNSDGKPAPETLLVIKAEDALKLDTVAAFLRDCGPHARALAGMLGRAGR